MSSVSVQSGNKKLVQCAGDLSSVASKNVVSVLENFPGWKIKNVICVRAKCGGWHSKMESMSSGNIQSGSQKWRTCTGEVSRVEYKYGISVLEKCSGWQIKLRRCAGEVSRLLPKNRITVLQKCPGWQTENGVSVQ